MSTSATRDLPPVTHTHTPTHKSAIWQPHFRHTHTHTHIHALTHKASAGAHLMLVRSTQGCSQLPHTPAPQLATGITALPPWLQTHRRYPCVGSTQPSSAATARGAAAPPPTPQAAARAAAPPAVAATAAATARAAARPAAAAAAAAAAARASGPCGICTVCPLSSVHPLTPVA